MATDRTEPAGVASPPIEPFFLTRREAAESLRVCEDVFDALVAKGEIKVSRIGRKVLVRTTALRAWADRIAEEAS